MSELLPMLSGTPDEFELLLLRSADDDEPRADALGRVGAALGVSASALALASGTAALASHAAVAGNGAVLAKHLTLWSLGKWLLVGVTAGLMTGGAARWVSRETPAPHAEPAAVATAAPLVEGADRARARNRAAEALGVERQPERESPPAVAANPVGNGVAPSAPLAPEQPAPTTPALGPSSASFAPLEETPARAVAAAPAPAAAVPASTLGEETKAIDRVRADLAAKLPYQALAELERYRATWPHGALAAEATLLRVDALLRAGDRAGAEREANTLIGAAPQSRYATRARALLQK